jgi:hypothetical protein
MPDQEELPGLLWNYRGEARSFDAAFLDFASDWKKKDPSIARALFSLHRAQEESMPGEVSRSLRRVVSELTEDAKRDMARYVDSLDAPATALFALGVLLPVLLATMIPVAGLERSSVWMLAFFLWILLPLSILLYGRRLVMNRPLYGIGVTGENKILRFSVPGLALLSAGSIMLFFSLVLVTKVVNSGIDDELLHLAVVVSIAVVVGGWGFMRSAGEKRYLSRNDRISSVVPDLLHNIGALVHEGRSFEGSLDSAVNDMEGDLDDLRWKVSPIPGTSADRGKIPPELDHTINTARMFSRAGSETGGKAIKALGSHLREIKNLRDDLSSKVKAAVGQMEITASFIAPLMIGGSIAIFHLLESTPIPEGGAVFMPGSGSGDTISGSAFIILTGIYLILLSVTTTLVLYRLRRGDERGGWYRVPSRVLMSTASYAGGFFLGSTIIG